jgi:hypothetical protein
LTAIAALIFSCHYAIDIAICQRQILLYLAIYCHITIAIFFLSLRLRWHLADTLPAITSFSF